MVNYTEAKKDIFWNKVKWLGACIVWLIPAGISAAGAGISAAGDWAAEKCDDWAQSYSDEAQQIDAEAKAQKDKENNQWKEGLKRSEKTDKDVRGGDSDFCLIM